MDGMAAFNSDYGTNNGNREQLTVSKTNVVKIIKALEQVTEVYHDSESNMSYEVLLLSYNLLKDDILAFGNNTMTSLIDRLEMIKTVKVKGKILNGSSKGLMWFIDRYETDEVNKGLNIEIGFTPKGK